MAQKSAKPLSTQSGLNVWSPFCLGPVGGIDLSQSQKMRAMLKRGCPRLPIIIHPVSCRSDRPEKQVSAY
jgi:hypothetical protein